MAHLADSLAVAVVEAVAVVGSDNGPRHTARAIVVHDGQLLLMERWRDDLHYFSIPGGGIDPGETPEQTVVREILEETNLTVEIINLVIEMHDEDRVHKIFLCKYIAGEVELPSDSPESIGMTAHNRFKPGWVPVDQVGNLPYKYWEPLKNAIVRGIDQGFAGEVTIVSNS